MMSDHCFLVAEARIRADCSTQIYYKLPYGIVLSGRDSRGAVCYLIVAAHSCSLSDAPAMEQPFIVQSHGITLITVE